MSAWRAVHLSTSDIEGGSARSAWRIHSALLAAGVGSRMIVGWKSSDSDRVATLRQGRIAWRIDNLADRVTAKLGLQYCFIPSAGRIASHPWVMQADILQFYNLHGGYMDLALLPVLARRAPIIWRLSDLWPLTGHCAYPGDCVKWMDGCGGCPDLATYPAIGMDRTAALWQRKSRLYREAGRFTVVAPSSWTKRAAEASPLLQGRPVHLIPNGIDTARFRPMPRQEARAKLGIADDRPALVFVSHIAIDNPRKGTDVLEAALKKLPDPQRYCLIVAGRGAEGWRGRVSLDVYPMGFVEDEDRLALIHAAGDVEVIPSAVENLPNTALEALACGKPIVATDAGGMADAVREGETGHLVPPRDASALAKGISGLLGSADARAAMGERARALALTEFAEAVEAERFLALQRMILDERRRAA